MFKTTFNGKNLVLFSSLILIAGGCMTMEETFGPTTITLEQKNNKQDSYIANNRRNLKTISDQLNGFNSRLRQIYYRLDEIEKNSSNVQTAKSRSMQNEFTQLKALIKQNNVAANQKIAIIEKQLVAERAHNKTQLDKVISVLKSSIKGISTQPISTNAGNYKIFTVKAGYTLSTIAQAARCSVKEIKRLNGLKNDTIYIGQQLKIPNK